MGCRILHDTRENYAVLYCSTTMFAFGPVFTDMDSQPCEWDACESAEAFLRWLDTIPGDQWRSYDPIRLLDDYRRDPRILSDTGIERAYYDWLKQSEEQWTREEHAQVSEP